MDKDEHGSSSESEDEALGKYHEALSRTHNSRLPLADSRQRAILGKRDRNIVLFLQSMMDTVEASIDEGKIG